MKQIMIKTEKLCKSYSSSGVQQHILKNLDLKVYSDDFTVIMGSSGAGKSTLLYALSGMDSPTLGKIIFEKQEISGYSSDELSSFRLKNCGFVFQQIYLIDSMSVMDNVLAAGLLASKDKQAVVSKAKQLFSRVGISELLQKKFPSQLSGGEAQRVGIVRALINSPQIVFADEPTGALNSASGKDVLDTLTEANEKGQSVIMVTHDLKSARRGNRVIYLKDGVICGECDLGKYKSGDSERHERLKAFLAQMGW